LPGQLNEIISQLEHRGRAIDRALSALRDVDGIESLTANAATATAPPAPVVRTRGKSRSGSKRSESAVKKTSTSVPGKADRLEVPFATEGQTSRLKEGTMKARTVELLRRVGRPINSGEVAKRMKIGAGYASVNLSQLRRDGFLTHTPEGYTVI
jgi:hypothetical protein